MRSCENPDLAIHRHHIRPRYDGGSDNPENLVELSRIRHAMWHWASWQRTGEVREYGAYNILIGRTEEAQRCAVVSAIEARKNLRGNDPNGLKLKEKGLRKRLRNGQISTPPTKSLGSM